MKIKMKKQVRGRDFTAIYECEHCRHTQEGHGYDDDHFHQVVIPAMKCKGCGNSTNPAPETTHG